ncbi:MAG: lytic transglycosylase domain-containing protein [Deltaproteobacteria bacterium]|nr:MAG: lytic transglycosylase domain-containing protein [Deltaproteobacteria bacterium]
MEVLKKYFSKYIGLILSLSSFILLPHCASNLNSAHFPSTEVIQIAHLIQDEVPLSTSLDSLEIAHEIVAISKQYEMDPILIISVIKVESQFRPYAHSSAGARGLMQIMPCVIKDYGKETAVTHVSELFYPQKNLRLGVHYLTYLMEKYSHHWDRAIAAYNWGPASIDQKLQNKIPLPKVYYKKVMDSYRYFQEKLTSSENLS